jgi:GMP reductase
MQNSKHAYRYSDVALAPKRGVLTTRRDADTSVLLGKRRFKLPVIPANMKCTIDWELAKKLSNSGYFYVMHRFDNTNTALVNWASVEGNRKDLAYISMSVGVKKEDRELVSSLKTIFTPEYITLDIAHGHSLVAIDMIKYIKDNLPGTFLIAGNVATSEGVTDLVNAGADAVKVGIGQGNACTTKDKTGFTIPMFTCVRAIKEACNVDVPIIADGGIKSNGDIAKAIVAGADMVMCGSLFAECCDSPSEVVTDEDGVKYKLYFGSASEHNKQHKTHIEGTLRKIRENNITYLDKLEEIKQDLSSAVSYSGGASLSSLKNVSYYIVR